MEPPPCARALLLLINPSCILGVFHYFRSAELNAGETRDSLWAPLHSRPRGLAVVAEERERKKRDSKYPSARRMNDGTTFLLPRLNFPLSMDIAV